MERDVCVCVSVWRSRGAGRGGGGMNGLIGLSQLLSSYEAVMSWPASTRKITLKTMELGLFWFLNRPSIDCHWTEEERAERDEQEILKRISSSCSSSSCLSSSFSPSPLRESMHGARSNPIPKWNRRFTANQWLVASLDFRLLLQSNLIDWITPGFDRVRRGGRGKDELTIKFDEWIKRIVIDSGERIRGGALLESVNCTANGNEWISSIRWLWSGMEWI